MCKVSCSLEWTKKNCLWFKPHYVQYSILEYPKRFRVRFWLQWFIYKVYYQYYIHIPIETRNTTLEVLFLSTKNLILSIFWSSRKDTFCFLFRFYILINIGRISRVYWMSEISVMFKHIIDILLTYLKIKFEAQIYFYLETNDIPSTSRYWKCARDANNGCIDCISC